MTEQEIREILDKHKRWLADKASGQRADLRGANLDYSALPLWCGGLHMKTDRRIMAQIAYHFCAQDCNDPDYIKARNAILDFANTFHRAKSCGLLKPITEKEQKMGELIARKALLKELKRYTTYDLVAVKTVERAPTVDAVPVVHGWWNEKDETIRTFEEVDVQYSIECSVCGRRYWDTPGYDIDNGEYPPFCLCGAKMDLEDGNE